MQTLPTDVITFVDLLHAVIVTVPSVTLLGHEFTEYYIIIAK